MHVLVAVVSRVVVPREAALGELLGTVRVGIGQGWKWRQLTGAGKSTRT